MKSAFVHSGASLREAQERAREEQAAETTRRNALDAEGYYTGDLSKVRVAGLSIDQIMALAHYFEKRTNRKPGDLDPEAITRMP